jgi:PleD family two-component response regulator
MITSEFQTLPLILVVDDEKMTRLVMRRVMEKDGFDIVEACNSRQCLEICQEKQTDIVLLDAVMPGIDSFTCCEQLKGFWVRIVPPHSNYYKSKRSRLGRYRF